MTTKYKTKAFIFKKNNINDSDRVFSVFTNEFGRLDIFAKAIRKNTSKLRSGIDTFFMSDIEFIQGKRRKTLTDAAIIEKFNNITGDLERFKTASEIGEILDNFIKGEQKDEKIFNLLNETFSKLNDNNLKSKKCAMVYYYFLWNALSLFGYCPEVHKCNTCSEKLNPYNIYFSEKSGGIICGKCLRQDVSAKKINSDIVKILRLILGKEWQTISRLKVEPASQKLLENISESVRHVFCPAHC
jgi:DNA repair protein RecO (recombination protein O)